MAVRDPVVADPLRPPPEGVPIATGSRRGRPRPGSWTRRRKTAVLATVVAVFAAAAPGIWAATGSRATAPSYAMAAAVARTLRQTVSATGTVEPARTANLDFAVSGQVSGVGVAVGQTVRRGQALAKVNASSLATQVAQANASVAAAQARLTADTSAGALAAQITADQTALSAARTAYTAAKASLAQATHRSPIAGKVAAVTLTAGQQVSGGSATTGTGSGGSSSLAADGSGASSISSSGGSAAGGAAAGGTSGVTGSTSSPAQVVVIDTTGY